MKLKIFLFPALLSLAAAPVQAQDASAAAEPALVAPVKKAGSKAVTLIDPPAAALVKSDTVNVRGQPSFNGEVLGHLKKGDTVSLEAQITLRHPQKGEPAAWSQIAIPTNMVVWVNADLIDADAKTVKAHRINLRGGPGENYSIVGRLEKGAPVTEIRQKSGWMAIQPPTNAYAFVAAVFLEMQAAPAPVAPPPEVAPVAPAPTPAAPEPTPAAPPPAAPEPAPVAPAPTSQNQADQELSALRQATSPALVTNSDLLVPRIVTREGYVHKAYNLQAPESYELHDIESDRLIEYLQPTNNMNLHTFVGTRVTVTGPELLDPRWPRTPILQVQSIGLIP